MSDPNTYTRIANALTVEQRAAFLVHFAGLNPHWRGANVDDVLAELANADANLDVVEDFLDAHPKAPNVQLVASAVRALLWAGEVASPAAVFELVARA